LQRIAGCKSKTVADGRAPSYSPANITHPDLFNHPDKWSTVMPITRELFYRDSAASMAFAESRWGVLLHELGHWAAANEKDLISGHLIIEDRDDFRCVGAFALDDMSQGKISADAKRRSFVAAAGAVAELYFCDRTKPGRLGPDIESYLSSSPHLDPRLSDKTVVSTWHNDYLPRVEALAGCIDVNFDRCAALLLSNRFLLHGYHVIPSCMLRPPARRGLFESLYEMFRTLTKKARFRALKEYLAERQQLRLGVKNQFIHF
jgi:hypothetical protein